MSAHPHVAPPMPAGRQRFSIAEWWPAYCQTFELRAPADDVAGLIPTIGHGHCLTPLGQPDDVRFFDPSLPAEHGDLAGC